MSQVQSAAVDIKGLYRGFDAQIDRNETLRASSAASRREDGSSFSRLTMNDPTGFGHWDVLRLHDDLLVCAADSYYHRRFDLDIRPPVDLVSLRYIVSGELHLRTSRDQRFVARQGTASLFRVSSRRSHAIAIEPCKRLASLTLHIPADRLATMLGMDTDELPELVGKFLQPDATLQYCSMPLTAAMKNAVLDVVDVPFDGALRRRYLEAKVMELLCLFVDAAARSANDRAREGRLAPAERDRLYQVRDMLSAEFLDPPSIGELARRVGINRTKLQRGFKEAFGMTIFDYSHRRRMSLARELLHDRGLSIGEVAAAVGYGHATNFTAAFRRHFQQLPKQTRRE